MSDFLHDFARRFAALMPTICTRSMSCTATIFSFGIRCMRSTARQLQAYFAQLYANVSELGFTFHGYDQVQDGSGYLRWTLHYRHPRLSRGQRIDVAGCSHLLWHEKVYQHRDYFDAGALLYEHLPLMGPAIGWLKGRLA